MKKKDTTAKGLWIFYYWPMEDDEQKTKAG